MNACSLFSHSRESCNLQQYVWRSKISLAVSPVKVFALCIWKPSTQVLMFGHLKRSVLICIFCGTLFGLKKIAYAFADYFPNKFLWNKTSTLFTIMPSDNGCGIFKLFPNINVKKFEESLAKAVSLRDLVSQTAPTRI